VAKNLLKKLHLLLKLHQCQLKLHLLLTLLLHLLLTLLLHLLLLLKPQNK
jgi:hypothetical protein